MSAENKTFTPLEFSGGRYRITKGKRFVRTSRLQLSGVSQAFDFAAGMTFEGVGQHRSHRSGGRHRRSDREIFIDTFQGKIAEFAFESVVGAVTSTGGPELFTSHLGRWEDVDFVVGPHRIAVKSTKWFGNLLLLESADWNEQGEYVASLGEPVKYRAICLVRLGPDLANLSRSLGIAIAPLSIDRLREAVLETAWLFDIPGWIDSDDLRRIVGANQRIARGTTLGRITLDADNYYVQAGELRPVGDLLREL